MKKLFLCFLLCACAGGSWVAPDDFQYVPIKTNDYEIASWQKIKNPKKNLVHIYIEGDGRAFDAYGMPSSNPTPRGTLLRDLVVADDFENVVYLARPCQFIMDENCTETDWTDGRFSKKIIDAESIAVNKIAKNKHVVLVGYSGGAMVSGLIIKQNPKLKIDKWITVAGVLNHKQWTQYFGDRPLSKSLNMDTLPNVPQVHFVGGRDKVVPYDLAGNWAKPNNIKLIPDATHDDFGKLKIFTP